MKKLKVIAIVLALGIIFTGCNMVEVNEERDRETVIAKVGDEVVLKGEFLDQYQMYEQYGYFPEDFATNPEYADIYEEQVKLIVDGLVDVKVLEIAARDKGCFEFTAEEQQEINDEVNSVLDLYVGMYAGELKELPENADKTEEEITKLAFDNIDEYFTANNFGITKQDLVDDYEAAKAQEVLYDLATKDIDVTEDEVKVEYDAKVEGKKDAYEQATANFEQDANSGEALYYIPENVRQAQHILITISEEAQDAIDGFKANGDDELAEIKLTEALQEIKGEADAAYQRAVAGEDFKLLIEELGQDPGMQSSEYYTVTNPTLTYVTEFAEGLFALENVGDISEPIATSFGYHIIKYYGDMESGPVPYDDLHDDIYETLLKERKDAQFDEQKALWRDEIDITTYYNRVMQ